MKPTLSFAQILEEKLSAEAVDVRLDNGSAPNGPTSSTKASATVDTEPSLPPDAFSFDWSALVKAKLQGAYPRRAHANQPPAPPRPTSEPEWPVEQLSTGARLALEKLYIDSRSISRTMVKRAYRRLAKRLHPDVIHTVVDTAEPQHAVVQVKPEAFLLVQEAYDIVMHELEQLEPAKAA